MNKRLSSFAIRRRNSLIESKKSPVKSSRRKLPSSDTNRTLTNITDLLSNIHINNKPSFQNLTENSPRRMLSMTNRRRSFLQESIKVADYEILEVIGKGSYAVVRKAKHIQTQQVYAVKIYSKEHLQDQKRRDNLNNEIKILSSVDHVSIVKLHEAVFYEDNAYLFLEFIPGISMLTYIKSTPNRRLKEPEAKKFFNLIMRAVDYLHSNSITHRDLKLENILMDSTVNVKIIDLGFSTQYPPGVKTRSFCGTPSYMAPEIVNKIEYAGPPVDVWACGILLCLMLTGKYPYIISKESDLYERISVGDISLPDMPEAPKKIIMKMLSYDPEDRPTARDVLNDPWLKRHVSKPRASFVSPMRALKTRSARRNSMKF